MKIAIMQPYFFPYLGYIQLVDAVDKFIFYDDVNYIKGGWINRNNILIKGQKKLFTLNLIAPSPNKDINEIKIGDRINKVLETIKQTYSKAPYFRDVFPVIESVFSSINEKSVISKIAGLSVIQISKYLNLEVDFEYSSEKYPDTKGMGKAQRLIEICKKNNADIYINATGGKELYSKEEFKKYNISLFFIKSNLSKYKQFNNDFVPYLSIIDVMMFNPLMEIHNMLDNYELE